MCACADDKYRVNHQDGYICANKKSMNMKCTSDMECLVTNEFPLKCVQGSCICEPTGSVYATVQKFFNEGYYNVEYGHWSDIFYSQCVGKAGKTCIDNLCTENARCNANTGVCECYGSDFESYPWNGLCQKKYGASPCNKKDCGDGLACVENVCKCKYGALQIFSGGKCVSIVDAPCNGNTSCIENAVCEFFPNTLVGSCKCKPGYTDDKKRGCKVAFGEACQSDDQCDDIAGLKCVNEKCECENYLSRFNESGRVCVGLVGGWSSMYDKEHF